MSIITWDLEIAQPVEEVPGGWDEVRKGGAGISAVCLYDTASERYHTYDEFDLDACVDHLNSADILVGFNSLGFDTPVLETLTGATLETEQYDILAEVWRALSTRQKGYKLKDICERLNIGTKVRTGDSAPNLYRDGRFGKLFDYCINDVHLTRKLANWINTNGHILTPDHEPLSVNSLGVEV